MSTTGTKTITVSYGGKQTGFTIQVTAVLQSIAVTTPPSKTNYLVGETFNPAGLVITGTYSDNSTAVIPAGAGGYTLSSPDNMSGAGEKTITVTYQGKQTGFTITIRVIQTLDLTIGIPSDGNITVSGIPGDGIKLSRSGGGYPAACVLTITVSNYSSLECWVNGIKILPQGGQFTLKASDFYGSSGGVGHSLNILGLRNGVPYSREIPFTVYN
jgi:hypothetical protein